MSGAEQSAAAKQEAARNDAGLTVIITGILTQFWRAEGEPEEMRVREMDNWLSVLEGMNEDSIGAAWVDYQQTGPRGGEGRCIDPMRADLPASAGGP